jgi:hypothetical protein
MTRPALTPVWNAPSFYNFLPIILNDYNELNSIQYSCEIMINLRGNGVKARTFYTNINSSHVS